MFERFAPPTRRILVEAEAEARELSHHFIDTQHLVLGMLVPDPDVNSPVRAMLLAAGLDLDTVREVVGDLEPRRISAPIIGTIPFTPQCKKVLELSFREAISRGSQDIQPEHLLLGILRERRSEACKLLDAHGVTADSVRAWLASPGAVVTAPWTERRMARVMGGNLTAGGRHVLDAARQAAGGPESTAGSHHILLGVLDEPNGLGARVLTELGITREAVDAKIAELGAAGTSDGPPPARVMKVGTGVEVRIDDPELAARVSGLDAAAAGDLIRRALLDHLGRADQPPV